MTDELLRQVVTIVHEKFNYPFVHCFVLDPTRERLVFAAGTGAISKVMAKGEFSFGLADPRGLVAWSAREGQTFLANDVSREPLYLENALPPAHTRAEMTVPLKYGGEILGVLDLQSDRINAFGEEDRFILEALAAGISTALRNANLYQTERWRRKVAESYKTIAELFSTQFTLEVVYQAILRELMQNLPSSAGAIYLFSQDSNRGADSLETVCVEGVEMQKVKDVLHQDDRTADWLLQVLQSDQPRVRQPENPAEPLGKLLGYANGYSAIAAPMWTTDRMLGVIVLVHPQGGRFGEEAASMLATFAGYISIAIQNNQLYASSVEQAWISTVMLQVAEAAQSAENVEGLLQSVARILPLLVGINECAFYLLDGYSKRYRLVAQEGFGENQAGWLEGLSLSPSGAKAFEKVRKTRKPARIGNDHTQLSVHSSQSGHRQYYLLPLFAREEVLGTVLVENRPADSNATAILSQTDQRMMVLQGIARQTAVAMENLQLKEASQSEGYITAVLLQVRKRWSVPPASMKPPRASPPSCLPGGR